MASKNGSSNKYTSEFKFQKDIKFNSKPLIAIQRYNKIKDINTELQYR